MQIQRASKAAILTNVALLGIGFIFFGAASIELPENIAMNDEALTASSRLADPTVAPNGLWTIYAHHAFTFAHRIPAFFIRQFGTDAYLVEELRFLLIILAAVFGIFYLSLAISRDRTASFLAVFLVLSTNLSALGWYFSWTLLLTKPYDAYVALATVIVSLALLYCDKPKIAVLIVGLLFNYHMVHSLLAFTLLLLCLVASRRYSLGSTATMCGIYLLACAPLLIYGSLINPATTSFLRSDVPPDQWWKMVRVMKYTTIFPTSQRLSRFLKDIVFVLAFLSVLLARIRQEKGDLQMMRIHKYTSNLLGGVIFFALIGTLFTEFFPVVRFLASAQPYRSSLYVMIIGATYVSFFLVTLVRNQDWFAKFSSLLCLVALSRTYSPGLIMFFSVVVIYWSSLHSRVFPPAASAAAVMRRRWRGTSFLRRVLVELAIVSILSVFVLLTIRNSGELVRLLRAFSYKLSVGTDTYVLAFIWISGWILRLFIPAMGCANQRKCRWLQYSPTSAVLIFLVAAFAFYYYISNGITAYANPQAYERKVAWRELQLWARNNSPGGSVFINPFELYGFETLSERSALLSVEELGSLSLYVPDTFYEELSRARDYGVDILTLPDHVVGRMSVSKLMSRRYRSFTEQDFRRLGIKYGASYLIVDMDAYPEMVKSLSFQQIYQNRHFAVYLIDARLL